MELLENVNLQDFNTFKLPCIAKYFCTIKNRQDFEQLVTCHEFLGNKKYMLGLGANTIFPDKFDGIIIKNEVKGKKILNEDDEFVFIKVGAGEVREDFVVRCAQNNYVGMENLAYIPSSIGASAVQNIGAYGSEAKDIISEIEYACYNEGHLSVQTIKGKDCKFGYRDSIFKHELSDNVVILSVIFKLQKYNLDYKFNTAYTGISQKIEELGLNLNTISPIDFVNIITEIRNSKLPDWHEIGTAGSFFKNPVISPNYRAELQQKYPELKGFEVVDGIKLSAGQLIDMSGFKGKNNGKVGTYSKHALILVNEGSAKGSDVLDFSSQIQSGVFQKFGIKLEPEAIFVN